MIDYFKGIEFFVTSGNLSNITSKLCNCFSTFLVPSVKVPENGPPCNADEFSSFHKNRGIKLFQIPLYNPQV